MIGGNFAGARGCPGASAGREKRMKPRRLAVLGPLLGVLGIAGSLLPPAGAGSFLCRASGILLAAPCAADERPVVAGGDPCCPRGKAIPESDSPSPCCTLLPAEPSVLSAAPSIDPPAVQVLASRPAAVPSEGARHAPASGSLGGALPPHGSPPLFLLHVRLLC